MKHPQITDLNQNYVLSGRLARDVISNINSLPENLQDNSLPQNQSPFVIGAVCNDTAASYSLSQGYIMGLGDLVITPSAANATASDPKQWLNLTKTYYVEKYDPSTHAKFCVLISPSPASNKTAIPAIVGGVAKVKVDVLDISHKYATFKSTQPDMPSSSTPFPCQLETAVAGEFELANPVTETGERWCSAEIHDLDDDQFYVVGEDETVTGDAFDGLKIVSEDLDTGIVTVAVADEDSQDVCWLETNLAANGRAIASTRSFITAKYTGDAPSVGDTVGVASGTKAVATGYTGYKVMSVDTEAQTVRLRFFTESIKTALFNLPSGSWSSSSGQLIQNVSLADYPDVPEISPDFDCFYFKDNLPSFSVSVTRARVDYHVATFGGAISFYNANDEFLGQVSSGSEPINHRIYVDPADSTMSIGYVVRFRGFSPNSSLPYMEDKKPSYVVFSSGVINDTNVFDFSVSIYVPSSVELVLFKKPV